MKLELLQKRGHVYLWDGWNIVASALTLRGHGGWYMMLAGQAGGRRRRVQAPKSRRKRPYSWCWRREEAVAALNEHAKRLIARAARREAVAA
jgi:hypothetical protein